MVAELWAQLVGWLHLVFVEQFDLWILFGFIAQAMFFMHFLVQWIASERAGRRALMPMGPIRS